ncbi:MAG: hypothetical protein LBB98_12035 [Treponema sp.]|nr:hypothetical protein [Treponema sp.]
MIAINMAEPVPKLIDKTANFMEKGIQAAAVRMKMRGMPIGQIAEYTGLSIEETGQI